MRNLNCFDCLKLLDVHKNLVYRCNCKKNYFIYFRNKNHFLAIDFLRNNFDGFDIMCNYCTRKVDSDKTIVIFANLKYFQITFLNVSCETTYFRN